MLLLRPPERVPDSAAEGDPVNRATLRSAAPSMGIFRGPKSFYQFVVDSNVALHADAAIRCTEQLRYLIAERPGKEPVRVLDLACGASPVTIASAMRAINREFSYTGIDSSREQVVGLLDCFDRFPENVTRRVAIERDAWRLDQFSSQSFDFIFVGLNLHHGTPAENALVAQHIYRLLTPGGRFFNHDSYRPEGFPLVVRPLVNPEDPLESLEQVPLEMLPTEYRAIFDGQPTVMPGGREDWRNAFVPLIRAELLQRGGDPRGCEATAQHIIARDYSLTLSEIVHILRRVGFDQIVADDFKCSTEPLREWYGTVAAHKPVNVG